VQPHGLLTKDSFFLYTELEGCRFNRKRFFLGPKLLGKFWRCEGNPRALPKQATLAGSCADDFSRHGRAGGIERVGVGFLHLDVAAIGTDEQAFAVGARFDKAKGSATEAE
jgi:hypothetical protein